MDSEPDPAPDSFCKMFFAARKNVQVLTRPFINPERCLLAVKASNFLDGFFCAYGREICKRKVLVVRCQ